MERLDPAVDSDDLALESGDVSALGVAFVLYVAEEALESEDLSLGIIDIVIEVVVAVIVGVSVSRIVVIRARTPRATAMAVLLDISSSGNTDKARKEEASHFKYEFVGVYFLL